MRSRLHAHLRQILNRYSTNAKNGQRVGTISRTVVYGVTTSTAAICCFLRSIIPKSREIRRQLFAIRPPKSKNCRTHFRICMTVFPASPAIRKRGIAQHLHNCRGRQQRRRSGARLSNGHCSGICCTRGRQRPRKWSRVHSIAHHSGTKRERAGA